MHPPGAAAAFPIVGIGASAGGLEAFTELLRHLPLDTGMGFVLVQHLDPVRHSSLTELLAKATRLPVCEVTRHSRVEPNHIYVISPNTNLVIAQGVLKLRPRQKTGGVHRSRRTLPVAMRVISKPPPISRSCTGLQGRTMPKQFLRAR